MILIPFETNSVPHNFQNATYGPQEIGKLCSFT